jgi:hypothetical protein
VGPALGQCFHAQTGTLALTASGETWAERSAAVLATPEKSASTSCRRFEGRGLKVGALMGLEFARTIAAARDAAAHARWAAGLEANIPS